MLTETEQSTGNNASISTGRSRVKFVEMAVMFDDPWSALRWLLSGSLLLVVVYTFWHIVHDVPTPKCPEQYTTVYGTELKCPQIVAMIERSRSDVLKARFDKNKLLRSVTAEEIENVELEVDAYIAQERPALIARRYETLRSIATFALRVQDEYLESASVLSTESDAAALDTTQSTGTTVAPIPPPQVPRILVTILADNGLPLSQSTQDAIAAGQLDTITSWLNEVANGLTSDDPATGRLTYLNELLDKQKVNEELAWVGLVNVAESLYSDIGFRWLRFYDGWWILELVFWSWFGLLTNTGAAILTAIRNKDTENRYRGDVFLLIVPKLFLAPMIAIIVAAIISVGLTDFSISLANAPFFVVFAFLSGFASERFTAILRESISHLLPRFGVSETKGMTKRLNAAEDAEAKVKTATTLAQLRTALRIDQTEKARASMVIGSTVSTSEGGG